MRSILRARFNPTVTVGRLIPPQAKIPTALNSRVLNSRASHFTFLPGPSINVQPFCSQKDGAPKPAKFDALVNSHGKLLNLPRQTAILCKPTMEEIVKQDLMQRHKMTAPIMMGQFQTNACPEPHIFYALAYKITTGSAVAVEKGILFVFESVKQGEKKEWVAKAHHPEVLGTNVRELKRIDQEDLLDRIVRLINGNRIVIERTGPESVSKFIELDQSVASRRGRGVQLADLATIDHFFERRDAREVSPVMGIFLRNSRLIPNLLGNYDALDPDVMKQYANLIAVLKQLFGNNLDSLTVPTDIDGKICNYLSPYRVGELVALLNFHKRASSAEEMQSILNKVSVVRSQLEQEGCRSKVLQAFFNKLTSILKCDDEIPVDIAHALLAFLTLTAQGSVDIEDFLLGMKAQGFRFSSKGEAMLRDEGMMQSWRQRKPRAINQTSEFSLNDSLFKIAKNLFAMIQVKDLSAGSAVVKKDIDQLQFADCVETTLRNLILFLIETGGILDPSLLDKSLKSWGSADPRLTAFFERFPSITSQESAEARNAWAQMITEIGREHAQDGLWFCKKFHGSQVAAAELESNPQVFAEVLDALLLQGSLKKKEKGGELDPKKVLEVIGEAFDSQVKLQNFEISHKVGKIKLSKQEIQAELSIRPEHSSFSRSAGKPKSRNLAVLGNEWIPGLSSFVAANFAFVPNTPAKGAKLVEQVYSMDGRSHSGKLAILKKDPARALRFFASYDFFLNNAVLELTKSSPELAQIYVDEARKFPLSVKWALIRHLIGRSFGFLVKGIIQHDSELVKEKGVRLIHSFLQIRAFDLIETAWEHLDPTDSGYLNLVSEMRRFNLTDLDSILDGAQDKYEMAIMHRDFLEAVEAQDIERCKVFLQGPRLNISAGGDSALTIAMNKQNISLARFLLTHGAPSTSKYTDHLAHAAVVSKEMVELLLEHGASVSDHDNSALISAARSGHEEIVKLLIAQGADPRARDNRALIDSIYQGKPQIAMLLLNHGVDPRVLDNSSVQIAVEKGFTTLIEYILDKGVPIGDPGALLNAALKTEKVEMVKLLVAKGCDVKSIGQNTLLQIADSKKVEIMKILFEAGLDPNAFNQAVLMQAVNRNNQDVVRLLLDKGADPNVSQGQALIEAARFDYKEILILLLKAGADPKLQDGKAEKIAEMYGRKQILKILRAA